MFRVKVILPDVTGPILPMKGIARASEKGLEDPWNVIGCGETKFFELMYHQTGWIGTPFQNIIKDMNYKIFHMLLSIPFYGSHKSFLRIMH